MPKREVAQGFFRSGDSPFSVRGSRNSGPDAPSDALAPSGQERRDSSQDSWRFQSLCEVSDLWVARSGTMPQADLECLLERKAGQRNRDFRGLFFHPPHTVQGGSTLPLKESAFSLWNRLKSISYWPEQLSSRVLAPCLNSQECLLRRIDGVPDGLTFTVKFE